MGAIAEASAALAPAEAKAAGKKAAGKAGSGARKAQAKETGTGASKRRAGKAAGPAAGSGKRNKELGRKGEEAAARFLEKRGYEILERNWECFAGEADIIAKDADTLVFVEVKTRRNTEHGFPSEAVDRRKREKYEKIALAYAQECDVIDVRVRFDVVSIVVIGKNKAMIRHDISAFAR